MDKKQIIERMYELQVKYDNNIKELHKDKEFIELSRKIGNYKPKKISLQKIIIKEVN